jgi:Glycoside-hydrolase family GH114
MLVSFLYSVHRKEFLQHADGHQERNNGLALQKRDTVDFVKFLSQTAAKYGMATGLKNAMDTISEVRSYVRFAVNEECAVRNECSTYNGFKKPIFHIEYPPLQLLLSVPAYERRRYCVDDTTGLKSWFHTVMKAKKLDGGVEYCDGVYFKTPTKEGKETGGRIRPGKDSRPIRYAVSGDDKQGVADFFKAWQFDDDLIAQQEELARQDGYPYAPGRGSERYFTDKDLGGYELEVPELPELSPEEEFRQPQKNKRSALQAAETLTSLPDVNEPKR